jgi:hypothetical protein
MSSPSKASYLRIGASFALTVVVASAVAVLMLPTPSNAAAIGVRDTDPCIGKCNDRHLWEAIQCNYVTIQKPGTLGNKSISQQIGDERVDAIDACLVRAESNLAACIDGCDSRTTQLTGRGGVSRSSFSVQRSR